MEWFIIFAQLIEALVEILENKDQEAVFKCLRRVGFRVGLTLRKVLWQNGLRGAELREAYEEGVAFLKSQSNADLRIFMEEADEIRQANAERVQSQLASPSA